MSEVFAVVPPTQELFEREWVWTDVGNPDGRESHAGGAAVAKRSPLKRKGVASDTAPAVVLFDSLGCVTISFCLFVNVSVYA